MAENRGLLSTGLGMVGRNKRYILWFYLLNLTLAEFGVAAFRNQAHAILDHSLESSRLVHSFDLSVLIEMFARPEFGPTISPTAFSARGLPCPHASPAAGMAAGSGAQCPECC